MQSVWFAVKLILFLVVLLVFQIVYNQEGMLYHPAEPVQYPHLMKEGYQNPAQQHIDYKNVTLVTEDGVQIWGWFLFGNSAEKLY